MFFPCTTGETVQINGKPVKHGFETSAISTAGDMVASKESVNDSTDFTQQDEETEKTNKIPDYLTKPTVVMCNPNALVY